MASCETINSVQIMKQQYKGRKTVKAEKPTRPFDGLIRQLNKESLVLVNLDNAKSFIQECGKRGIICGVGSKYNGGLVIYKKN